MDQSPSSPAYRTGDHLRVRRGLGYFHHGIFIGDGKVVQFGGRIGDKPGAKIGIVELSDFEAGDRSEAVKPLVVDRLSGLFYTEPDPPEEIVERALWLVENYPPGRYNLLGNNCETMAVWCRSGGSTESLQTRGMIYVVRLFVVWPIVLWFLPRLRKRGRLNDRRTATAQFAVYGVHLIPTVMWAYHRYRFARFIRREHPATREWVANEKLRERSQ